MRYFSFLCLFIFLLSGCIGKKKHYALLSSQEMKLENIRRGQVSKLQRNLGAARDSLRIFEIEAATKSGSISTLENLRLELAAKNRELEERMEALNSQSASQKENLNQDLATKENELNELKQKIEDINKIIQGEEIQIGALTGDLRSKLEPFYSPEKFELLSSREGTTLAINESLLFQRGSISKLSSEGTKLIQSLVSVINNYPAMDIKVIGHTDDGKPSTGYSDNWTISVVRSVKVVRVLEDNGVSPNQIMAAGKGEYAPMASNSTPEGQTKNRRIDLVFSPAQQILAQKIRKITQ